MIVRCITVLDIITMSNAIDAVVPITRFNRGEANKIFNEVREAGCKVVVKNNTPACVLIDPVKFKEMVDMIEDQYLLALAEEREKNDSGVTYTAEEGYAELGITDDGLDEIEVEFE